MLLVLNLPLVGLWVKLLQIPRPYLYAGILVFAALGAYAANFTVFDIGILAVLGVLGFFMRRQGFPVAPLVIGAILGPMAEEQLRKAMQIGLGNPAYLVHSTFSIVVYVILFVIVVLALWLKRRRARFETAVAQGVDAAASTSTIRTLDLDIEATEAHPEPERGILSTRNVRTVSDGEPEKPPRS